MIYLDPCAVVKLLRREEHSSALYQFLVAHGGRTASSTLARVEVARVLIREQASPDVRALARRLFSEMTLFPIDEPVLNHAEQLPDVGLRSLGAIHLATAQQIGKGLTAFVTYDARLAKAAQAANLPETAPGIN